LRYGFFLTFTGFIQLSEKS